MNKNCSRKLAKYTLLISSSVTILFLLFILPAAAVFQPQDILLNSINISVSYFNNTQSIVSYLHPCLNIAVFFISYKLLTKLRNFKLITRLYYKIHSFFTLQLAKKKAIPSNSTVSALLPDEPTKIVPHKQKRRASSGQQRESVEEVETPTENPIHISPPKRNVTEQKHTSLDEIDNHEWTVVTNSDRRKKRNNVPTKKPQQKKQKPRRYSDSVAAAAFSAKKDASSSGVKPYFKLDKNNKSTKTSTTNKNTRQLPRTDSIPSLVDDDDDSETTAESPTISPRNSFYQGSDSINYYSPFSSGFDMSLLSDQKNTISAMEHKLDEYVCLKQVPYYKYNITEFRQQSHYTLPSTSDHYISTSIKNKRSLLDLLQPLDKATCSVTPNLFKHFDGMVTFNSLYNQQNNATADIFEEGNVRLRRN